MSSDIFSLDGKVAIVTGAANGIGKSLARAMAEQGALVMATDIDVDNGEQAAAEMRDAGLVVEFLEHDVVDEQAWRSVVDATLDRFDGLDVLVNNAGAYEGGLLQSNSLEQVRRVQQINVDSIFLGMKFAVQAMSPGGAAGKGGSIINVSSAAGMIGVPGHSAYGATKGAVRLYTKHAAVEFGALDNGVRVNSLHPGLIETAMGEQVFEDFLDIGLAPDMEAARQAVSAMIPMKRFGQVEEMAGAVIFLASDASSYVTGTEIVVDGGICAS